MAKNNSNDILLLLLIGVIVYFLFFYNKNIKENLDVSMNTYNSTINNNLSNIDDLTVLLDPKDDKEAILVPRIYEHKRTNPRLVEAAVSPYDNSGNQAFLDDNYTLNVNINDPINSRFAQQSSQEKPKLTSNDLLPGKPTEKWFETPDIGTRIEDANLLSDAIMKVGVDTVGQTRKNPSYDIRGTIPCPKFAVSPWNNSTYEPDINIKPLCN